MAGLRKPGSPPLGPEMLKHTQLTIVDAVLCSEMGVHFSPCGRYLAACVACKVGCSIRPSPHDSAGT